MDGGVWANRLAHRSHQRKLAKPPPRATAQALYVSSLYLESTAAIAAFTVSNFWFASMGEYRPLAA